MFSLTGNIFALCPNLQHECIIQRDLSFVRIFLDRQSYFLFEGLFFAAHSEERGIFSCQSYVHTCQRVCITLILAITDIDGEFRIAQIQYLVIDKLYILDLFQ
jgi:hypothetical protein